MRCLPRTFMHGVCFRHDFQPVFAPYQNMREKLVRSSVDQDAVNEDLTYMQKGLSSAGICEAAMRARS
jgi:hypothetical protein